MTDQAESGETPAERVQAFAERLRGIREDLSYVEMERRTGCSHEKLQAAAAGKEFPDWKTVEYYVTACGHDLDVWRAEWQEISVALGDRGVVGDGVPAPHDAGAVASSQGDPVSEAARRRLVRRPVLVMVGVVLLVVGLIVAGALIVGGRRNSGDGRGSTPTESGALSQPLSTTTTSSPASSAPQDRSPGPPGKTSGSVDPDRGEQPTTTTSVGALDPGDPDREDSGGQTDVQAQRDVELIQEQGYNWVDIEYWRHDASTPGELQINTEEVFTNLGAKLTVIPDSPLADRARCARASGWRDRISFSELHVGSQLCALSHLNHYASMAIRLLPNSPASGGRFTFYGITWWNGT